MADKERDGKDAERKTCRPLFTGKRVKEFITMPAWQHPAMYVEAAKKGTEVPPDVSYWISYTP
jgi:hypothetical protein